MTIGAKKQPRRTGPVVKTDSDERRKRVAQIVEIQQRGDWEMNRRQLVRTLAAQWNVQLSTVERYSCEAHNIIVADRLSIERVRDEVNANLWDIVRLGKREVRTDDGKLVTRRDLSAANNALKTLARVNGLEAPMKHEVSVSYEQAVLDALTEEETEILAAKGELPEDIEERVRGQANGKAH